MKLHEISGDPILDLIDTSTDVGKREWLSRAFFYKGDTQHRWHVDENTVWGVGNFALDPCVKRIPFPIKELNGNLTIEELGVESPQLETFENFPKHKKLTLKSCNKITDWSGLPLINNLVIDGCEGITHPMTQVLPHLKSNIRSLLLKGPYITSLVGCDEVKREINMIGIKCPNIKEGGLGLLMLLPLNSEGIVFIGTSGRLAQAAVIIENYDTKPDDIFECQTELLDKGLDEFAQL